jgi:hypothetical protein
LKVALADIDEKKLFETGEKCSEILGGNNVLTVKTDVSKLDQVVRLRDRVYESWGEVMFSSASVVLRSYCLPGIPFYLCILCSPYCAFGF